MAEIPKDTDLKDIIYGKESTYIINGSPIVRNFDKIICQCTKQLVPKITVKKSGYKQLESSSNFNIKESCSIACGNVARSLKAKERNSEAKLFVAGTKELEKKVSFKNKAYPLLVTTHISSIGI